MKLLLLLGVVLLMIPSGADGQDWVDFTVARHVNTPFAAADFDNAMAVVNDRMKYDNHDCADDVPCTARFFRNGNVGTFGTATDGLDWITTQAGLDDIWAVTTHRVKVVSAVDFCAGTFNPSFIGCGRTGNFGFVVEDWVGADTYVHEFGHNVGLGHRDDCPNNIMNTFSIGTNNSVNTAECSTYGGRAYTQLCGNVYDGAGGPLTVSGGPYWVTCDVAVPSGETLTIQAGVEIQFQQGLRIVSDGYAIADGSTSRITIYSNNQEKNFPTATVDNQLIIRSGGQLIFQ